MTGAAIEAATVVVAAAATREAATNAVAMKEITIAAWMIATEVTVATLPDPQVMSYMSY